VAGDEDQHSREAMDPCCLYAVGSISMSSESLRVLLLEDVAADAELVTQELMRGGRQVVPKRVDSRHAFVSALDDFAPDVVISDHALAQFDAIAALKVLRAVRPTVPLIVVSGMLDVQAAVECLRSGAEDIVLKGNLARLGTVITTALALREPLRRLTRRQLQVLGLVAEGLTTRQIARDLKLSAKTVETHRGEIMKRLAVHDVVGLVRNAIRFGLVRPDG
jgi:DNA-binding NarL/FixJ family response regulator